jgi:pilus assembly protein CpaF
MAQQSMYTESLRAFLKPVLQFLDDESVTEIMINGPEDIWIERKGKVSKTDIRFSEEGLLGAARNMAQFVGRPLTDERPRLDARLPDGSRIHVVLPPIARKGTTISIRKFFKDKLTVDRLVSFGSITPPMVRTIEAAVLVKLNMVVSGGTGSGKTTLLNVLSNLIPMEERILTIEDSAELQLNQEHLVPFESRPADKFGKGEVNMGMLLQSALRLRPDRIVVGEVRGGEAFDLMQAMNTGHGGSMATVHANTPTDTLRRLESLCLMSGVELPMVAVRAQVASAINFIVCCERLQDGSRKTIAVSEVLPLNDKGDYRTQDLFLFVPVSKDEDGNILGYHAPTGILPTFLAKARAYGFSDLSEAYFDPATYGVPPPPLLHGVGESVNIQWVPSLKHREKHLPDPEEFQSNWTAFEERLRDEAKQRKAGKTVPIPGFSPLTGGPVQGPSVAARPRPPAAQVPARARPASGAVPAARPVAHDDLTPPPTRNPLLARKSEEEPEALVELSESLMGDEVEPDAEATNGRAPYPVRPPARPAGAVPARPVGAPRPGLPPRGPIKK